MSCATRHCFSVVRSEINASERGKLSKCAQSGKYSVIPAKAGIQRPITPTPHSNTPSFPRRRESREGGNSTTHHPNAEKNTPSFKKSSKISSKRFTNDRNPGQLEPGHNNEKSFKSSHRNASFTSTATSNQHIKPKNHTTNSETGLTNPGNFSTITQLPSVSNQPPTSGIHVNKSQDQEKCEETAEVLDYDYLQTIPPQTIPGLRLSSW